MVESEEEYTKRVTSYKHILKGIAFFSNADTVSAVATEASQAVAPSIKDYKFLGGAAIACSSIATLSVIIIYCKKLYDEKYAGRRVVPLPSTYLIFLLTSCILSIIGSALLIKDQRDNGKATDSDLHIAGAIIFALAKIINPVFTSTLVVADSLEQNNNPPANPAVVVAPVVKPPAPVVKSGLPVVIPASKKAAADQSSQTDIDDPEDPNKSGPNIGLVSGTPKKS